MSVVRTKITVVVQQQPSGKWGVVINGVLYGVAKARYDADFAAALIERHGLAACCREHLAAQPLYFDDAQRHALEMALGHNCQSPGVVIAQLKTAVTLKVDGIDVELPPNLQQRLRSRVFRAETYPGVVRREVVKALKVFAGLLPA